LCRFYEGNPERKTTTIIEFKVASIRLEDPSGLLTDAFIEFDTGNLHYDLVRIADSASYFGDWTTPAR
jgi:hypothetical protein